MVGGQSFLTRCARAARRPAFAGGLLTAAALALPLGASADESVILKAVAECFDSPTNVFTGDENIIQVSQTVASAKPYTKPVESPPALALEIVQPKVVPVRVAAPASVASFMLPTGPGLATQAVPAPPSLGLAIQQPTVVPQRVVIRNVEPPSLDLKVAVPPTPDGSRGTAPSSSSAGTVRYDGPEVFHATPDPLQIQGLVMTTAQDPPPPAPPVDAPSGSTASTGAAGSLSTVEKLGDAPPANTLQFLRQEAILLAPGKCQVDLGLTYSIFNSRFSVPVVNNSGNVIGVANERERLRLMTIPLALRYGVCDGLQAYINCPLGWSNSELADDVGNNVTNNFVGTGDISAGFNFQLMKACGTWCPDVIGSIGFIAPSGHATFTTSLLAANSFLGQGFWDITTSVIAVHTLDPIVFYYGGGYIHRFDGTIDGINVDPGEEFDYLFGVGFAVNPWATISGTLLGSHLTRFGVNGVSIPGSDQDPIRFRVSVTMVKDKRICEPFAEIAMTPDAPSRLGIVLTY